jgi:DNA repair exonuclease SbcCD nuclease subunit
MVCILAIGDPHIRLDNLNLIPQYIESILDLVKQHSPDFVVLLGDILHCHERIHTSALNYAYEMIYSISQFTKVYILVGNHDYINNSQFLTQNHWMNAMKQWENVIICDSITPIQNETNFQFTCLPYVFPGRFEEALNTCSVSDWTKSRILFCHQEFKGCKMGAIESIEGDEWKPEWPMVISGHIHDKQWVGGNVYYPGSSIQHAFGESHNKTVALCQVSETTITVEELSLGMPQKHIKYMNIETIESFSPELRDNDAIRITLDSSVEEFKVFRKTKKYKELVSKGVKIVHRAKEHFETVGSQEETKRVKTFAERVFEMVQEDDYMKRLYKTLFDSSFDFRE